MHPREPEKVHAGCCGRPAPLKREAALVEDRKVHPCEAADIAGRPDDRGDALRHQVQDFRVRRWRAPYIAEWLIRQAQAAFRDVAVDGPREVVTRAISRGEVALQVVGKEQPPVADTAHVPEKSHSVVRIAAQAHCMATAYAGDERGRRPVARRGVGNGQVKQPQFPAPPECVMAAVHGKRHPASLGAGEVEAFPTALAVDGRVAASTQNQAKSAPLFLRKEALVVEQPWPDGVEAAKAPPRPRAWRSPLRCGRGGRAFGLTRSN